MQTYNIKHHSFTYTIINILQKNFGEYCCDILSASPLLIYINNKTKSANRGSKSRNSFANHYALYVLIEDYIKNGFLDEKCQKKYSQYEGARFTDLFIRQRELPFGAKLQNHALNSRLNDEFKKFFPSLDIVPIIRDVATQRYWIQEKLLLVTIRDKSGKDLIFNIAPAIIEIINNYIEAKQKAFNIFITTCQKITDICSSKTEDAINFITSQLSLNTDARIFEIVSYAVLKIKYGNETIWIGETKDSVCEEFLMLYKTGRTNANDGGIDFVMRPIGRFFQVTETIDVNKYFLDIDKVNSFPITFVVKSKESPDSIREQIKTQAMEKYGIEKVVQSYMNLIEEIINVNVLIEEFSNIVKNGLIKQVMDEIILQSKIEFNYEDDL